MDNKIISQNRYKKITRSSKQKKNVKAIKNVKTMKMNKIKIDKEKVNNNYRDVKVNSKKKNVKKTGIGINFLKVVVSICVLILVGYLSKLFINMENNPIIQAFSPKKNESNIVANYDFKIGVNKLGNTDILKTANVLSNELIKYSNIPLVTIDEKYNIQYKVLKKLTKVSDTEYELELDSKYNVKPEDVVSTVNNIKNAGSENAYYAKIQNIKDIIVQDNKVKVSLKSKDSYFMYSLNFPIYSVSEFANNNYYYLNSNNISSVNQKFTRNDSNTRNILNSITIQDYEDSDNMLEDFRNNNIDMFLTSSYNVMQLLGKHEYSMKKYRNGETIFLFGNKESDFFKQKEVRQAIAYAIDRNEIIKNLESTYAELIDLPYIYSNTKYRYDKTGAENILLANAWKKNNGVYSKSINGQNRKLEINMLVNKEDGEKIKIAESIRQMLEQIGIKLNVLNITTKQIDERMKNNDYDMVLTTVYINDNPNTEYLEKFLNINDVTNTAFQEVKNSDITEISNKIGDLQNILSQEIACIGIFAKDTNVVYQKYITGFESIGYMRIFNSIENIGKMQ